MISNKIILEDSVSKLIKRHYTKKDETYHDVLKAVNWTTRHVEIKNNDGKITFAGDVVFPDFWSDNAVTITASRYFYRGNDYFENSLVDLITRVITRLGEWLYKQYPKIKTQDSDNSSDRESIKDIYMAELAYILLYQIAAFNSPVYFNLGINKKTKGSCKEGASACYIVNVEDDMDSIKEFQNIEFEIFKSGAGSGANFSKLRGSMENIKGGGTSSGPISFMEALDSWAGRIRSAGRLRRAAIMRILDIDHPDIENFIDSKVIEEKKARALTDAGFTGGIDGSAYRGVCFQNENHSVRVDNEFMDCVINNKPYELKYRKNRGQDGNSIYKKVNAKDLLYKIAQATHFCGDPGVHFKDTINKWNTIPNSGEIESSNPCLSIDSHILTIDGYKSIGELLNKGQIRILIPSHLFHHTENYYDHFITVLTDKRGVYKTGTQQLFKVTFSNGKTQRFTENHKIKTVHYGFKQLKDIDNNITAISNIYNEPLFIISKKPDGIEDVYDITVPGYAYFVCGSGAIVHNCSEVFNINNTSCNLASINITKFSDSSAYLDFNLLKHVIHIMTLSQDIIIDNAEYPHKLIADGTKNTRSIGLGITNLGNFLMEHCLPYDSNESRTIAITILGYLTSIAYLTSYVIGTDYNGFPEFDKNRNEMSEILDMHADYLINGVIGNLDSSTETAKTLNNIRLKSSNYLKLIAQNIRNNIGSMANSFVTSQAPTGTISFMMDATTTGIEPELALIKYKKIVGGGTLKIINNTVVKTLKKLDYSDEQVTEIENYILEHETIENAPYLAKSKYPIFHCSFGNENMTIKPHGHLAMIAAIQPVISQGISKTLNVIEKTTVDDIYNIYIDAWKMGLKCVSIYRDGSKNAQPLTTKSAKEQKDIPIPRPARKPLPNDRKSVTHKFSIGNIDGYLTVGMYDDGNPGEIFITMAKIGTFAAGIIDCFATTVSIGLQYGVPLTHFIEKFKGTKFEPSGITQNEEIRFASSVADYVGKWLENKFIKINTDTENKQENNKKTTEQDKNINIDNGSMQYSYNICQCGGLLIRAGTCEICPICGETTGCS